MFEIQDQQGEAMKEQEKELRMRQVLASNGKTIQQTRAEQRGDMKYNGLRKRGSYEEIVDYLANKQQKVKYPDRWAKRVRESP